VKTIVECVLLLIVFSDSKSVTRKEIACNWHQGNRLEKKAAFCKVVVERLVLALKGFCFDYYPYSGVLLI
jgi:hypothetical protein